MMQLQDFRFLPDEACLLTPEASQELASLIEARKATQGLFEFKLLEKEKVFPGEKFILMTEKINNALNSIDLTQKEETMKQELMHGLESLTLQETLIEKRDGFNEEINRRFGIEEEKNDVDDLGEIIKNKKGVIYNLDQTEFDEEKALQEGRIFIEELKGENKKLEPPLEKAVFNKDVLKKKMINEEAKPEMGNLQQKLNMLSFYNEMEWIIIFNLSI